MGVNRFTQFEAQKYAPYPFDDLFKLKVYQKEKQDKDEEVALTEASKILGIKPMPGKDPEILKGYQDQIKNMVSNYQSGMTPEGLKSLSTQVRMMALNSDIQRIKQSGEYYYNQYLPDVSKDPYNVPQLTQQEILFGGKQPWDSTTNGAFSGLHQPGYDSQLHLSQAWSDQAKQNDWYEKDQNGDPVLDDNGNQVLKRGVSQAQIDASSKQLAKNYFNEPQTQFAIKVAQLDPNNPDRNDPQKLAYNYFHARGMTMLGSQYVPQKDNDGTGNRGRQTKDEEPPKSQVPPLISTGSYGTSFNLLKYIKGTNQDGSPIIKDYNEGVDVKDAPEVYKAKLADYSSKFNIKDGILTNKDNTDVDPSVQQSYDEDFNTYRILKDNQNEIYAEAYKNLIQTNPELQGPFKLSKDIDSITNQGYNTKIINDIGFENPELQQILNKYHTTYADIDNVVQQNAQENGGQPDPEVINDIARAHIINKKGESAKEAFDKQVDKVIKERFVSKSTSYKVESFKLDTPEYKELNAELNNNPKGFTFIEGETGNKSEVPMGGNIDLVGYSMIGGQPKFLVNINTPDPEAFKKAQMQGKGTKNVPTTGTQAWIDIPNLAQEIMRETYGLNSSEVSSIGAQIQNIERVDFNKSDIISLGQNEITGQTVYAKVSIRPNAAGNGNYYYVDYTDPVTGEVTQNKQFESSISAAKYLSGVQNLSNTLNSYRTIMPDILKSVETPGLPSNTKNKTTSAVGDYQVMWKDWGDDFIDWYKKREDQNNAKNPSYQNHTTFGSLDDAKKFFLENPEIQKEFINKYMIPTGLSEIRNQTNLKNWENASKTAWIANQMNKTHLEEFDYFMLWWLMGKNNMDSYFHGHGFNGEKNNMKPVDYIKKAHQTLRSLQ